MIYTDGQHLIAESIGELHKFAKYIGMKREWFQDHPEHPHYDLIGERIKSKAERLGATKVSKKTLLLMSKELRRKMNFEIEHHIIYQAAKEHKTNIRILSTICVFLGQVFPLNKEENYATLNISNQKEIVLGSFENDEFMIIAFFHELGHVACEHYKTINPTNRYEIEKEAWKKGFELALSKGITFSFKAFRFAVECLKTYNPVPQTT